MRNHWRPRFIIIFTVLALFAAALLPMSGCASQAAKDQYNSASAEQQAAKAAAEKDKTTATAAQAAATAQAKKAAEDHAAALQAAEAAATQPDDAVKQAAAAEAAAKLKASQDALAKTLTDLADATTKLEASNVVLADSNTKLATATDTYNASVDASGATIQKGIAVGAAGAGLVPGYGTIIAAVLGGVGTLAGVWTAKNHKGKANEKQSVLDEAVDAAATLAASVKTGLDGTPSLKPSPELLKALEIISALKAAGDQWSAKAAQA